MSNQALVVIDIQNDITKNYKEIIRSINEGVQWAKEIGMHVIYIRHENLSSGTRTFKPNTKGAELAVDLEVVSDNIFTKSKGNALTSEPFETFLKENNISEVALMGADAVACVKSTCYNMCKSGYQVTVLSDCITSYDIRKIDEMLAYYASKGSAICTLKEYQNQAV